jgi:hypothetical protein
VVQDYQGFLVPAYRKGRILEYDRLTRGNKLFSPRFTLKTKEWDMRAWAARVTLFIFAYILGTSMAVFAIDIAEEQIRYMEIVEQPLQDMEDIEDVMFDEIPSEDEMRQILAETPALPAVKKKETPKKKSAPVVQPPVEKEEPVRIVKAPKTPPQASPVKKETIKEVPVQKEVKKPIPAPVEVSQEPVVKKVVPKEEPVKKVSIPEAPQKKEAVQVAMVPQESVLPPVKPEVRKQAPSPVEVPPEPAVKKEVPREAPVKKEPVPETPEKKEAVPIAMVPQEAAPQKTSSGMPAKHKAVTLQELKKRLVLTDKQVSRIRPIMQEKIDKRKEIIRKYAGKGESAMASLKQEFQSFQKYYDDMYEHILTEAQWQQYQEMRKELKSQAAS